MIVDSANTNPAYAEDQAGHWDFLSFFLFLSLLLSSFSSSSSSSSSWDRVFLCGSGGPYVDQVDLELRDSFASTSGVLEVKAYATMINPQFLLYSFSGSLMKETPIPNLFLTETCYPARLASDSHQSSCLDPGCGIAGYRCVLPRPAREVLLTCLFWGV